METAPPLSQIVALRLARTNGMPPTRATRQRGVEVRTMV